MSTARTSREKATSGRIAFSVGVALLAIMAAFAAENAPLLSVGLTMTALLAAILIRNLLLAVGLLIAGSYFDSYLSVGSGQLTISKAIGLVAILSWAYSWLFKRKPIVGDPAFWLIGGLALWIPISVANAENRGAGMIEATRYFSFFALFFLVVQVVDRRADRAHFLAGIAVAAAAIATVPGLWAFFTLSGSYRAEGPLADANDYGFVLATTLPLGLFAAAWASTRARRVSAGVASILIATTALATISRGALVSLVAMFVWATLTHRIRLRWAVAALGTVAAIVGCVFLIAPRTIEIAVGGKGKVASADINDRLVYWDVALQEFRMAPIIGVGPGNYQVRFTQFRLPVDPASGCQGHTSVPCVTAGVTTTHNAYLNVLADLGIPGIALFVGLIATTFFRICRPPAGTARERDFAHAVAAGMVAAMVGCLFLTEQFFAPLWFLAALACSVSPWRGFRDQSNLECKRQHEGTTKL
jgi:putative inorganic carbon (hco3(-)) transporter